MNIDLIYPGREEIGPVPLGIISLSAYLRRAKYSPRVLNLDGEFSVKNYLTRHYAGFTPDVVGITTFTSSLLARVVEIVTFVRTRFPKATIILGGVHASIFAEEICKELSIDLVVVGEGEETLKETVQAIEHGSDLGAIQGIVYKKDGAVIRTPVRPSISDLNMLPRPEWEAVDVGKQFYVYLIESRGCPFSCSFCYNVVNKNFRTKEVDTVLADFRYLYEKYRIGVIKFWDDLPFGGSKKKMIEFCGKLVKEKIPIKWSSFTRCEALDDEVADAMVKAGCFRAAIGVESGSPRMLEKLNKKTNPDMYRKAYAILAKREIISVASFMIGLPDETEADLALTVQLAFDLNAVEYWAVNFKPYPGTELYKECLAKGFIPPDTTLGWSKLSDFYDFKFNVSKISTEALVAASAKILSLQNKGKARRIMAKVGIHALCINPMQELKRYVSIGGNRMRLRFSKGKTHE